MCSNIKVLKLVLTNEGYKFSQQSSDRLTVIHESLKKLIIIRDEVNYYLVKYDDFKAFPRNEFEVISILNKMK